MNLSPLPGDRWTLTLHDDILVLKVTGKQVTITRGEPLTLATYLAYAMESLTLRGAVLHRNGDTWTAKDQILKNLDNLTADDDV